MCERNTGQRDSREERREGKRKLNHEQYDLLKHCSEKKDVSEWNKWRTEHLNEPILLQDAKLSDAYLANADLRYAHLENADLRYARLENADLKYAHLENALLWYAHLENVDLRYAHLDNAILWYAHLENARLVDSHLENARLVDAHLENADLRYAHLEDADLEGARLQNTVFWGAHLQGANFEIARVDGATLVWQCKVDQDTNFEGVGLSSVRIDAQTRQFLEYNIRRMNWQRWYRGKSENRLIVKMRQLLTCPIRSFWWVSNYGSSTWRIVLTFLALSISFAAVYFAWGAVDYYHLGMKDQPGIVKELFVPLTAEEPVSEIYYSAIVLLRSLYFSVVATATLGFGDVYANTARPDCRWWVGHSLLIVQVILGYILLGALVTRFAVLFTAGGPPGNFVKGKKK